MLFKFYNKFFQNYLLEGIKQIKLLIILFIYVFLNVHYI